MMTRAPILLLYERVLPGGQVMNRVKDMGYRVVVISEPAELTAAGLREKPLLVMVDMAGNGEGVLGAVRELRERDETAHLPVIAFGAADLPEVLEAGRAAGATLVVTDAAILAHLNELLEQALHLD